MLTTYISLPFGMDYSHLYIIAVLVAMLAGILNVFGRLSSKTKQKCVSFSKVLIGLSFGVWLIAVLYQAETEAIVKANYDQLSEHTADHPDKKLGFEKLKAVRDVDAALGYLICLMGYFIPYIRRVVDDRHGRNWLGKLTISGYATLILILLGILPGLFEGLRENSGFIKILLHSLTGLSTILALGGETYRKHLEGDTEVWKVTSLGKVLVLVIVCSFILSVAEANISELSRKEAEREFQGLVDKMRSVKTIVDSLPADIQSFDIALNESVTNFEHTMGELDSGMEASLRSLRRGLDQKYFNPILNASDNTTAIRDELMVKNSQQRFRYDSLMQAAGETARGLEDSLISLGVSYVNLVSEHRLLQSDRDSLVTLFRREEEYARRLEVKVDSLSRDIPVFSKKIDLTNELLRELQNIIDRNQTDSVSQVQASSS